MPSADRFFSGRGSAAPGILRLVRASIALSPLADVTAGGCLAAAAGAAARGAAIAPALACSLFLFLFGMAQNDLADRDRDALLRPERPIPSGAVSLRGARAVVLATGLAALSCGLLLPPAGRWLALLLFAAINGYNLAPRHLGAVGPLVLGLIRAGNLLLGAAALGPLRPLLPAAGCYLAYVAALSCAARLEDRAAPAPAGRLRVAVRAALLAALAAPAAAALALGCLAGLPAALACSLLLACWIEGALRAALRAGDASGGAVALLAGRCLAGIFLFDAALALAAGAPRAAFLLAAFFGVARALSRRFPPS